MSLNVTLESQDWVMIGNTKVMNVWPDAAAFSIDGAAPVLRAANALSDDGADTPEKRAYLAVQHLYLGATQDMSEYFARVGELMEASPAASAIVRKANAFIQKGSIYGAMREYRTLFS